ncbi:MAG: YbaY family lipoprotein [Ilumatobacteraceae bacterium]
MKSTAAALLLTVAAVLGACSSSGDDEGTTSTSGSVESSPSGTDPADVLRVTGVVQAPLDGPPLDQLDPDAIVTITLEDISLADVESTIISTQRTEIADSGFPVEFSLPYDIDDIGDANTYRVAARVNAHGDLVMITDTVVPVITQGAPTSGVDVPLVSIATN